MNKNIVANNIAADIIEMAASRLENDYDCDLMMIRFLRYGANTLRFQGRCATAEEFRRFDDIGDKIQIKIPCRKH